MDAIADRVAAGAELLDGIRHGWQREIDLETFDMATEDRCILGQLWGLWKHGLDALGLPRRLLAPGSEAVPYGFDVSRAMPRSEYEPLTETWRNLMLARRGEAPR